MVHLLSAIAVGAIYGGTYQLRGRNVELIRLSMTLFVVLALLNLVGITMGDGITQAVGAHHADAVSLVAAVLYRALSLQALLCTGLSLVSFLKEQKTRDLVQTALFGAMFGLLGLLGEKLPMLTIWP